MTDADGELAEKWEKLWKWTIYALIGMFLAVPVSALLGILGFLLLLAVMVATVICGVLKLVYLHTLRVFGEEADKKVIQDTLDRILAEI